MFTPNKVNKDREADELSQDEAEVIGEYSQKTSGVNRY